MNLIRAITRYVPRCSRFQEPTFQEVESQLIESGGRYYIKTPWAMLDATDGIETTDSQLAASLRPCFSSAFEAIEWAKLQAPWWMEKHNETVRGRLDDSIRWHGDFSGPIRLADAMGISEERLRGVVTGKYAATPKEARAAREWKGGTV